MSDSIWHNGHTRRHSVMDNQATDSGLVEALAGGLGGDMRGAGLWCRDCPHLAPPLWCLCVRALLVSGEPICYDRSFSFRLMMYNGCGCDWPSFTLKGMRTALSGRLGAKC
jgi:hypothetical protein